MHIMFLPRIKAQLSDGNMAKFSLYSSIFSPSQAQRTYQGSFTRHRFFPSPFGTFLGRARELESRCVITRKTTHKREKKEFFARDILLF